MYFKPLLLLSFYLQVVSSSCVNFNYPFFNQSVFNDFTIESGQVEIVDNQLVLTMQKSSLDNFGVAVTLAHKQFFNFGKISATIKIEYLKGAVSSFILMSKKTGSTDIRDEIDWEWVGNNNEVQTNYFVTDKPVFSVNGRRHFVNSYSNYHNYVIDWKKNEISWFINNQKVRTTVNNDLPTLESQVRMGIWDSGRSGSSGTMNWAGGPIDWSKQNNVKMYISSMKIECEGSSNSPLPLPIPNNVGTSNKIRDLLRLRYNSTIQRGISKPSLIKCKV